MNGGHDVTPRRLAELADGATPETGAEHDAVSLMADVRGLAEPAPDAVRGRVRASASAGAPGTVGWRRWLHGRRRLVLAAAPVAAAIVALAIAIPVATRDDAGTAREAAAPRAAPEAAVPQAAASGAAAAPAATDALRAAEPPIDAGGAAAAAELDRAVARARATLERTGATGVRVTEAADGGTATVIAEVPADEVGDAARALARQGAEVTVTGHDGGRAARGDAADRGSASPEAAAAGAPTPTATVRATVTTRG